VRQIEKSAWVLVVGSGVLQVLIFPDPSLVYLCWIAFTPLLAGILRARPGELHIPSSLGRDLVPATPGQALVLGWVCGIVWSLGTCYWVYHVMHVYGGLEAPVAAGVLVLFALIVGFHHGLFALLLTLAAGSRAHTRRALLLAPFLWVAVETARTYVLSFPWNLLGTVQVDNIPMTRIATVTGVYGLSFEIMLVNAAFAAAFLARQPKRRVMLAAALIAATVLQAGRLFDPRPLPADETARLVQQNIPILADWSPEYFQKTLAELSELSIPKPEELMGQPRASLIVWPESPAPFYIVDPRFRAAVTGIAQRANAHVVASSLGLKGVAQGDTPQQLFNSAALIAPNGEWRARYDKMHLVPFGEYVPFKSLLGFANKLTREVGDFVPGAERTVLNLEGYRVGAFICYESIFPNEVRQFAARGAQVFVNTSNDGWFGETGAPQQHLNMARMRAIENNRWLLRSTNTGITASIDPYGRVIARLRRNVRAKLDAPFSTVSRTTFYTRYGDWFAWGCAIIAVIAVPIFAPRKRRNRSLAG
jgi:apolipoprotein N-acyltransferase